MLKKTLPHLHLPLQRGGIICGLFHSQSRINKNPPNPLFQRGDLNGHSVASYGEEEICFSKGFILSLLLFHSCFLEALEQYVSQTCPLASHFLVESCKRDNLWPRLRLGFLEWLFFFAERFSEKSRNPSQCTSLPHQHIDRHLPFPHSPPQANWLATPAVASSHLRHGDGRTNDK